MKNELYTSVQHSLGTWNVYIVRDMDETTEVTYMADFNSLQVNVRAVDTAWRTPGLAVAYLKRLAKYSPDRSSSFILVPWDESYTIYFR